LISLIPNINPLQNRPFKKGDVIAQQRSMAPPSLCSGKYRENSEIEEQADLNADKAPPGFARHGRFFIT
jgi:hypothetical protein